MVDTKVEEIMIVAFKEASSQQLKKTNNYY